MTKQNSFIIAVMLILTACNLWLTTSSQVSVQGFGIAIHLRGVYESKINLISISGTKPSKSIAVAQGIINGETAIIQVSKEILPGESVFRFDY